ncbi:MAG: helix-turn-helix domain-containing protein [Thermoplasmata archaeon]|nr:helix-turn-helix domain-containing protein [Thermoplasmata archaeon]
MVRKRRASRGPGAPRGRAQAALPAAPSEGFALYRVSAQLPKDSWGYQFSTQHPKLRLELVNRIEVSPTELLVEVRMLGEEALEWLVAAADFPHVVHVESHPRNDRDVLYRVTFGVPSIHTVTVRHRVLTRYPIVIQNGWSRFETFASAPQMRGYLNDLRRVVGPGEIESVRRGVSSAQNLGLTPSQDAVFREALSSGYYAVPREISVTGLADRIGRSKSTVSVALMKIEKRLADSALQVDLASFRLAP